MFLLRPIVLFGQPASARAARRAPPNDLGVPALNRNVPRADRLGDDDLSLCNLGGDIDALLFRGARSLSGGSQSAGS